MPRINGYKPMRESYPAIFSFRVLLLVAIAVFNWSNSSGAETEQPFCRADARFAPDGRIVEIGERYFRVCGPKEAGFPYQLDPSLGQPLLVISAKSLIAHRVEAATNAPKYLWGHMVFQPGYFELGLENRKRNKEVDLGEIVFGGEQYSAYSRPSIVEEVQSPIEKGNLPRTTLFIFERPGRSEIPSHYMSCHGDPTAMPRSKYHCNVYLKYRESDDLHIKHGLIWNPIFEGEPMDFERLPDLVRAVHTLFEISDVTDQLTELEHVPVVGRVAD